MANFSQLRRRQSSRELLWRSQLAGLDLHEDGTVTFHAGMASVGPRQRRPSARASLRRQFSEAASGGASAAGSGGDLAAGGRIARVVGARVAVVAHDRRRQSAGAGVAAMALAQSLVSVISSLGESVDMC